MNEAAVGYTGLTPMLHVAEMARSIAFYESLGFEVTDTAGDPPVWAHLRAGAATIMLTLADKAMDPEEQGVITWLYVDDAGAAHATLTERAAPVGELGSGPNGKPQFVVREPDGYTVVIRER